MRTGQSAQKRDGFPGRTVLQGGGGQHVSVCYLCTWVQLSTQVLDDCTLSGLRPKWWPGERGGHF